MPARSIRSLGYIAFACVFSHCALAQSTGLILKVVTSNEANLYTNYSIIMGEKDAMLVDAPFTRSEAYRLAGALLETGKDLKYVYVTHDHPDHFFSKEVITDAFPDAKVIAAPAVVADIWRSIPFKIKRWSPMLGKNGPRYPTAPEVWDSPVIELEGHRIEIIGPMQGDHRNATALHVPSLRAVIAGDLVFHGIHPWLGEHGEAERGAWVDSLDRLIALEPEIVVAGHKRPGLNDDPAALTFTRQYIIDMGQAAKRSRSSAELIATMRAKYPDVEDVLDDFILVNSAQVAIGEVPPWEE
jgi:glyoxylase-like metal-dependent hydrolase (beta-lactamase superfamily II)